MNTRKYLGISISATLLLGLAACGEEQELEAGEYPTDDVTILVPYAPGGSTDALARSLAQGLEEHFDATFVVENQPGAGGATAISELLNAPMDGTMLGILASPTFLIPPISEGADYSTDDLNPVGLIAEQPVVLLENGESQGDFLADAEDERKTIGTNGPETAAGIDVQRLADESDLTLEQIPFEGQSELITNLMGDNVDAITVNVTPDILDGIENDDYSAIATFSSERIEYLPDTPTFSELGLDMASDATSQFGLFTAADADPVAHEELEDALETVLSSDEVREAIGEDYVSDDFVDGGTWTTQIEGTRDVYQSFFEGN